MKIYAIALSVFAMFQVATLPQTPKPQLRHLTMGKTAFSVWRMPDQSIKLIHEDPKFYLAWAAAGGMTELPSKPDPNAVFLEAGAPQALDTPDGWPNIGDYWEVPDAEGGLVLRVANSVDPAFYEQSQSATDPLEGTTSQLTTVIISGLSNWTDYPDTAANLKNPPSANPSPAIAVSKSVTTIPNHHSVAFDQSNFDLIDDNSPRTINITLPNNNTYLASLDSLRTDFETMSSVTWNGTSMNAGTPKQVIDDGAGDSSYYFDQVAPATGLHAMICTTTNGTGVQRGLCGFMSATGADQSTGTSATGKAQDTGSTNTPQITIASATGELVFSLFSILHGDTDTVDASWTSKWNTQNAQNNIGSAGAYKAGAASIVRQDTITADRCAMVIGSVKAAAGGVTVRHFLSSMGVGR